MVLIFQDQYKDQPKKRSRNANSESEASETTVPLLPKHDVVKLTSAVSKKRSRPKSAGSLHACNTDDHQLYTLGEYPHPRVQEVYVPVTQAIINCIH